MQGREIGALALNSCEAGDGVREFVRGTGGTPLRLCEGRDGLPSKFTTPFQGVPPRIPGRPQVGIYFAQVTPMDSGVSIARWTL